MAEAAETALRKRDKSLTFRERIEVDDAKFSIREVAEADDGSVSRVYEHIKAGLLIVEKDGRKSFVRAKNLRQYLCRSTSGATEAQ